MTCDRASKLGREILHEGDHQVPEGQIDIVVVDGLHGPRRKIWTAENGYEWLQKGLNADVPGARVILWGLDGTAEDGAPSCLTSSNECFLLHARKLLEDVLEQRLVTSRISRPIVFLAHGLGGLLVQKALMLAEEARKNPDECHRWYSIRLSTRGLILLDTPYSGHHEYSFEKMIENIASIYSKQSQVSCNGISVSTPEHFETAKQFECAVKRVFSDEKATTKSDIETHAVPQDSSDQSKTLKANHLTMTKFSSPDDTGYKTITALFKALEDGAQDLMTSRWASEVSEEEEEFGPDHMVTLDAMHGLAERWSTKKESHEKASKLMKRVVSGNKDQRGSDHPGTLFAIRDSGIMFMSAWGNKVERFKNASAILEPLLSRFDEIFGKEHEATIRLLDTLGHVRKVRLNYEGSETAYARASVAKEKIFGPRSVVFAYSVYYLSATQILLKFDRSAEHNLKRAILAYNWELGPDALMTILAWDMLGMVYMGQKRPIAAENVFVDLLGILEKKSGPNHFDTLACCHNLSLAFMMQPQHLVKAEQLNRRVVEGLSKPGPPTQFFLGVVSTTAAIQQERGFYKQAEKSYKKLISQCEEHVGPDAAFTRQVFSCVAQLYQRQGKIKKAQEADARAKGNAAPSPSVWSSMRSWVSDKKDGFSSGETKVKATFSSGSSEMPKEKEADTG